MKEPAEGLVGPYGDSLLLLVGAACRGGGLGEVGAAGDGPEGGTGQLGAWPWSTFLPPGSESTAWGTRNLPGGAENPSASWRGAPKHRGGAGRRGWGRGLGEGGRRF